MFAKMDGWPSSIKLFLDFVMRWLLQFLTSTFTSDASRHCGSEDRGGKPFHQSSSGSSEAQSPEDALGKAFRLFGMTVEEARQDPAAARARLLRERRNLSRQHHPDRNLDNSEEATYQMQHVNSCFDACCKELDALEGCTDPRDETEAEGRADHRASNPPQDRPADSARQQPSARASGIDGEEARRAYHKRRLEENQRKREQRRKEREEERAWQREFDRQFREVRAEVHRASQQERQDPGAAYAAWKAEVKQILTWWTPSEVLTVPKPIQTTMGSNPKFIAAAIRVDAADVAREEVVTRAYNALYELMDRRDAYYYDWVDRRLRYKQPTEADMMRSYLSVATEPLDEDKNTIFHYVSIYEDRNLFEFLMSRLGRFYKAALLKENIWGQIPADFCAVCQDRSFKERIDTATEHARKSKHPRSAAEGRQPKDASFKTVDLVTQAYCWLRQAAAWAEPILHRADWFRVVRFVLAVRFVGPLLFGHGWIVSLAPFVALQQSSVAVLAMYAVLWLARKVLLYVAYDQGPPMLLLPGWMYALVAIPFLFRGTRSLAVAALSYAHGAFVGLIMTLEKVSLCRNVPSRIAAQISPSLLECIELATYSALWWAACHVLNAGRRG
jgi:hypothetical protein